MAARFRVIILAKPDKDEPRLYQYALWADVPTARQPFYAQPAATVSAWKDALPADNAQLVSGAVVEKVDTMQAPAAWTITQIQTELQLRWQTFQTAVTNTNLWNNYGSTWNGTAWVMTGAA